MSPIVFHTITLCVTVGWGGIAASDAPLFARLKLDPVVRPGVRIARSNHPLGPDVPLPVWVFFTDKAITSTVAYNIALTELAASYGPRSVHRRALRRTSPGLFDHRDLPLAGRYVDAVLAIGIKLRTTSTWLNAVSVEADPHQVEAIAALPFVHSIRPLAKSARIDPSNQPSRDRKGAVTAAAGGFYGLAAEQLEQINIPAAHAAGYTGAGVIIGILDTGFIRTHEAFNEPGHSVDVLGEWDFVNNDSNTGPEPGDPASQHNHGTYILGTIGGYKPDTLVAGAYDAAFYLAKTEDVSDEYPGEEDYYVAGLQWIEANGADLATSSLGYIDWYTQADLDGLTAVTTIAVNVATANGLVCCTAAGNSSHDGDPATSHLIAPADAFEVLTCGAVNSESEIAGFSSDGPTADGRTKPEVLARGVGTWTVDPGDDLDYRAVSGTSLSTPLIASAAALIVQAHPGWTVSQIRSAIMQTAEYYLLNGTFDPLYVRGYGVIDVLAAIEMSFIGDLDADGDTDLMDFAAFHECMTGVGGEPAPGCESADIDEDGDVDMRDYGLFQLNFTGPWSG